MPEYKNFVPRRKKRLVSGIFRLRDFKPSHELTAHALNFCVLWVIFFIPIKYIYTNSVRMRQLRTQGDDERDFENAPHRKAEMP